MRIVGQQCGHLQATSGSLPASVSQTVRLDRRNISAEVAVAPATPEGDADCLSAARITQIESSAGTERPMLSVIGRAEVTSITFTLQVFRGSTSARWTIHHWE